MGLFSFFKSKSDDGPVPEWAQMMSFSEYTAFTKAIDLYFATKGIGYQMGDGVLMVEANDFGFGQLGLSNVLSVCKQSGNPAGYQEIVEGHFEAMARSHQESENFEQIASDFEKVKKYIGYRVYNESILSYMGNKGFEGKKIADGILGMVVYDLPDSVQNAQPAHREAWGKSLDEVIAVGIENIKRNYEFNVGKAKIGSSEVFLVSEDHFFVPNVLFDLDQHPELVGPYGALVGVPHRHAAIVYPIQDTEVIVAVNEMIPVVYGMNEEGPGSVSSHLFWYRNGTLMNLPYKLEEGKLSFIPPAAFVELLNEITG